MVDSGSTNGPNDLVVVAYGKPKAWRIEAPTMARSRYREKPRTSVKAHEARRSISVGRFEFE